jgi:hypothetical protein
MGLDPAAVHGVRGTTSSHATQGTWTPLRQAVDAPGPRRRPSDRTAPSDGAAACDRPRGLVDQWRVLDPSHTIGPRHPIGPGGLVEQWRVLDGRRIGSWHLIGPGDGWTYGARWTGLVRSGPGIRSAQAPGAMACGGALPDERLAAPDRPGHRRAMACDGSRPRRSVRRMRSAQETARASGMAMDPAPCDRPAACDRRRRPPGLVACDGYGPIRLRRDILVGLAHTIGPWHPTELRTNGGGGSSRIEESTFSTERDGEGGVTAGVSARMQP